jgi:hypothetical protein
MSTLIYRNRTKHEKIPTKQQPDAAGSQARARAGRIRVSRPTHEEQNPQVEHRRGNGPHMAQTHDHEARERSLHGQPAVTRSSSRMKDGPITCTTSFALSRRAARAGQRSFAPSALACACPRGAGADAQNLYCAPSWTVCQRGTTPCRRGSRIRYRLALPSCP